MESISVIRWYIKFKYDHILNIFKCIDDYKPNDEWPFLQIITNKQLISFGFENKTPQISIDSKHNVFIFHKYDIFRLSTKTCTGEVVSSTITPDNIPFIPSPLVLISNDPYTTLYRFEFDFHVMMTVISTIDNARIVESRTLCLTEGTVVYNGLKIEIHSGILSTSGYNTHVPFKNAAKLIHSIYIKQEKHISKLFNNINYTNTYIDPALTHITIDYTTWYRGARENQREWPLISKSPINSKSIEFPLKSNIYYTPTEKHLFVGLNLRQDNNINKYIPTLYKKDHLSIPSYLNDYLNNTNNYNPFTIPIIVSKTVSIYGKLIRKPEILSQSDRPITINYAGNFVYTVPNPNVIVYRDHVISRNCNFPLINTNMDAQLLDEHFECVSILVNNSWIQSSSRTRVLGTPCIPYYYRQIIHDYNKLGRLINGPYMDLMHIGIVDENGKDTITFPYDITKTLYISRNLETRRLLTFRYKDNTCEMRSTLTNKNG